MSCGCNSFPCNCCKPPPPACNCPPSPIPPWDRPSQSPQNQVLVDNSIPIVLDPDVTYLQASLPGGPINMVLPNGNFLKQMKRIMIPQNFIANTQTWVVSGTFSAGYATLTFNNLGTYALLEWDGFGWQIVGGNPVTP